MQPCPKCNGSGQIRDNTETGRKLKAFRKSKKLTLSEVATKIGFTKAYISDLEHGRRNWSDDLVKNYLAAIGIEGEANV